MRSVTEMIEASFDHAGPKLSNRVDGPFGEVPAATPGSAAGCAAPCHYRASRPTDGGHDNATVIQALHPAPLLLARAAPPKIGLGGGQALAATRVMSVLQGARCRASKAITRMSSLIARPIARPGGRG